MKTNYKATFTKLFELGLKPKDIQLGLISRKSLNRYYREWSQKNISSDQLPLLTIGADEEGKEVLKEVAGEFPAISCPYEDCDGLLKPIKIRESGLFENHSHCPKCERRVIVDFELPATVISNENHKGEDEGYHPLGHIR